MAIEHNLNHNDSHKELTSLLKSAVFVLSNVVADSQSSILEYLTKSGIYESVILPLYRNPSCAEDLKVELAYCIGNIFIFADFNCIKHCVEMGILKDLI